MRFNGSIQAKALAIRRAAGLQLLDQLGHGGLADLQRLRMPTLINTPAAQFCAIDAFVPPAVVFSPAE